MPDTKIKRSFRIFINLIGSTGQFFPADEAPAGAIIYRDIEFDLTEDEYASARFATTLFNHRNDLLDECVRTSVVELDADGNPRKQLDPQKG